MSKGNINNNFRFDAVLALTVHDIKNSLLLVMDKLDNDKVLKQLGIDHPIEFKYEIRRINNNLVKLLTLYKMGENQYTLDEQEYNIDDFLQELLLEYHSLCEEKQIQLSCECYSQDMVVLFDKVLISAVLNNTIGNAFRYANKQIKVRVQEREDFVKISVLDDGVGYPHAFLDGQEKGHSIDMYNGATGLGLFFSKMVAAMHVHAGHAGYIELSNNSELGGSCFDLYIPRMNFSDFTL